MVRAYSEIAEPVFAAIAARAAAEVPGVARLEPGLFGLMGSMARSARGRVKGLEPAPTDGVRVAVQPVADSNPLVRIEVDVVLTGLDQAAAVACAVQRAVTRAVTAATGQTPAEVWVSIMDMTTVEARA